MNSKAVYFEKKDCPECKTKQVVSRLFSWPPGLIFHKCKDCKRVVVKNEKITTRKTFLKALDIHENINVKKADLRDLEKVSKLTVSFNWVDDGSHIFDYVFEKKDDFEFDKIIEACKSGLESDISKLNEEFESL